MERVELEIYSCGVLRGSHNSSSATSVVSWCYGDAMVGWFSTKGAGLVTTLIAWRAGGGCVVKNVGCVVDQLEEEGDYVAASGWSNLRVEDCDTWQLLVG
ncbi:hypothetical protein DEO72_LG3g1257 [Vigna unguiculata]|nr:hypothetical protein DEO72_LG3g1257 [Vigna unguiculata]